MIFELILWIVIFAIMIRVMAPKAKKEIKTDCPPHKWRWSKQPESDIEYLQCYQCGWLPGQNDKERL